MNICVTFCSAALVEILPVAVPKKHLAGYASKIHVSLHVLSIAPTSKVARQFFVKFSKTTSYKGCSVVHENVICLETAGQRDGQSDIYRHLARMRRWQKFLRLVIGLCFKIEMFRTRIFCLGHISPPFHQLLASRVALQWHPLATSAVNKEFSYALDLSIIYFVQCNENLINLLKTSFWALRSIQALLHSATNFQAARIMFYIARSQIIFVSRSWTIL
jgi:hypothetical protein